MTKISYVYDLKKWFDRFAQNLGRSDLESLAMAIQIGLPVEPYECYRWVHNGKLTVKHRDPNQKLVLSSAKAEKYLLDLVTRHLKKVKT